MLSAAPYTPLHLKLTIELSPANCLTRITYRCLWCNTYLSHKLDKESILLARRPKLADLCPQFKPTLALASADITETSRLTFVSPVTNFCCCSAFLYPGQFPSIMTHLRLDFRFIIEATPLTLPLSTPDQLRCLTAIFIPNTFLTTLCSGELRDPAIMQSNIK